MSKDIKFCYNHPTTIARRKCYHCGKPICPECQHNLSHHIFCGKPCHKLYRRDRLIEKIRGIRPITYWKTAFFAAFLIIAAGTAFHFQRERGERPKPAVRKTEGIPADWSSPGRIEIKSPSYGDMAAENPITAEGNAPEGSIVGLYLNSDLIDLVLCKDGTFSFDNVKLPGKTNILQARFFDEYGNNYFSRAIMVSYRGEDFQNPVIIEKEDKEIRIAENIPGHIYRGDPGKRQIFLTFDGGSTDNSAREILVTLREHDIKSTIFLTGDFMKNYPNLTRQMVKEGHEVGNHTFSHPHLTTYYGNRKHDTLKGVTREFLHSQLKQAAALFKKTTGKEMSRFWRAPYGEHNAQIRRWASELGYTHIGWTTDSLDWVADKESDIYYTRDEIKRRILKYGRESPSRAGGRIVLMHLGTEREPDQQLAPILPDIIAELRDKGYTFEKVSAILGSQSPAESM